MGFTTRYDGILIHDTALAGNDWVAADEKPMLNSDDWDVLKVKMYKQSATPLTIENIAADFVIGQKLGARNFWLNTCEGPICKGAGFYEVTAIYKGWGQTHPVIVNYGAAAAQESGENIQVSQFVVEPKVTVYENAVTASVRYIIDNIDDAPTDEVGKAKTPQDAPDIGASHWSFLTSYTYHYPNGWVLMASNVERLPGTTVAMVTDDFQYIRDKTV